MLDRRGFVALSAAVAASGAWAESARRSTALTGRSPRFGMVTYLWGRDLPLPELLAACEASGLEGLELRTTHAHGVEPGIPESGAADIRRRFAESSVELVGLGSNERFDSPDPARLAAAMEATRGFLRCSAAVGGGGVKVKPDSFHRGVDPRVTVEQIGAALRELGPFAADLGQEIRLEVHGDWLIRRPSPRSSAWPTIRPSRSAGTAIRRISAALVSSTTTTCCGLISEERFTSGSSTRSIIRLVISSVACSRTGMGASSCSRPTRILPRGGSPHWPTSGPSSTCSAVPGHRGETRRSASRLVAMPRIFSR